MNSVRKYYNCSYFIDEETGQEVKAFATGPLLMDELSLAPEVVLISTPDCLLETQILPAPTKCPNVTHSLQYFHDTRVS